VAHLFVLAVVGCESLTNLLFVEPSDWLSQESAAAALENRRCPLGPAILLGKYKDGCVIAGIVTSEGEDWSQAERQEVAVPFFYWMLENVG
jgi:hypothetical protein